MQYSHTERMGIRRRIIREFAAGNYFRSIKELTLDMMFRDFPDELKDLAREELAKMVDERLLTKSREQPFTYRLNSNKYIEIQHIRNSSLEVMQPHEELIPEGFPKKPTFITEGAKDSKGVVGKYFYYERKEDGYWIVYIVTGINARPEKKEMGSINERTSDLFAVWLAVDKKLKVNKFYKAQLDTLIENHRIVQNRQPIKAAIDILEHLGYVRKTGVRKGKSEEYEKTNRRPPETGLDGFLGGRGAP